jgi:hypothetical protein
VRDAIVPGAPGEARNDARAALAEERERFAGRFPDAAGSGGPLPHDEDEAKELAERVAAIADSVRGDDQSPWAKGLALFDAALAERPVQEPPLTGVQLHAYDVADRLTQHVATIKRPSFYDRPTQWAFIACLPFAPWAVWVYFATKKRVYRLDDDGTLHLSDAAAENAPRLWKPQDIREIDMSQWMRKSIASKGCSIEPSKVTLPNTIDRSEMSGALAKGRASRFASIPSAAATSTPGSSSDSLFCATSMICLPVTGLISPSSLSRPQA